MAKPGSNNKIRVVIATPLGPGGQGGMDRLSDLLVETFAQRPDFGFDVSVLTTRGHRGLPSSLAVFTYAVAAFWLAIRRNEIDLLHINLAHGGSVYRKALLARMAHSAGIPYVIHLHGSRFNEFWTKANPRVQRVIATLFRNSAQVVVLGRYWEGLILGHLPELQSRISIVPNATRSRIGNNNETAQKNPVQICFLGLIGERKGTFVLLEALKQIKDERNWRATIAGNGAVERCRDLVESFGLSDRITLPGWLAPAAVEELLSRTDIFVLPSTAENLPMSILEAFAFGIAVVATPVGAVPEVIEDGRNGMIVAIGDAAAIAKALRSLIRNPELRRAMGASAKADHANKYDIEVYIKRLSSIWRAAAMRTLPRSP